jgi:hypothetical protein
MHRSDLNDLDDVGQLQPHAPRSGAHQEKSALSPAQLLLILVSSLVIRSAISWIGNT